MLFRVHATNSRRSTMILRHLFIAVAFLSSIVSAEHVVVSTKYGRVRGQRITRNFGLGPDAVTHTFDRYLGIPYAKPPIGQLRFQAPEEPDPWNNVLDATKHRHVCPQLTFHADTLPSNQNEDCLFLNVFTPYKKGSSEKRFPVMVYFHGGSYEVGSGKTYDGSVLAQMGVVVVTINYRLGALGFLSSGDSLLPGNYGLLDQALTLEWVNQNIAQFRGNSSRVTLFGHSVGASSVGLMMLLSGVRTGLFHGVIAQSGVVTAPYTAHHSTSANFTAYVRSVGKLFSCSDDGDLAEVVDCLRKVEPQKILSLRIEFPLYDPIDPEFRPFIDGRILSDFPRRLFEEGRFHKVPVIVGTVKDEFNNYFNGGARYRKEFDEALDNYLLKVLKYNPTILSVVRFQYTDWSSGKPDADYKRGDLLSDMHMVAPTIDMSDILSKYVPVYQYHFSVDDCYHSVELNYVFGSPFSGHFADEMTTNGTVEGFTEEQRLLSRRIMKLWTSFAKFGHPVSDARDWSPYTKRNRTYLLLSPNNTGPRRDLRADKVAFWNRLIPDLVGSLASNATPVAKPQLPKPTVNLWVLLASIGVLFVVVLLLTALMVRLTMENRRFKRTSSNAYITKHQL